MIQPSQAGGLENGNQTDRDVPALQVNARFFETPAASDELGRTQAG
jgi:hypothetical protein